MQSWEEEAVRSLEAHKSANLAYLVKFRGQGETLNKRRKEPDEWQQGLSSDVHTDAEQVFTHTLICTRIHLVNLTLTVEKLRPWVAVIQLRSQN